MWSAWWPTHRYGQQQQQQQRTWLGGTATSWVQDSAVFNVWIVILGALSIKLERTQWKNNQGAHHLINTRLLITVQLCVHLTQGHRFPKHISSPTDDVFAISQTYLTRSEFPFRHLHNKNKTKLGFTTDHRKFQWWCHQSFNLLGLSENYSDLFHRFISFFWKDQYTVLIWVQSIN